MGTRIPILSLENVLIASIQVDLDDVSMRDFQQDLLDELVRRRSDGVIVDITAIDMVDSFMARTFNDMANAIHLLGAQLVIVGTRPSLAITLVQMGLSIPGAIPALDLDAGMEVIRELRELEEEGFVPDDGTGQDSTAADEPATDEPAMGAASTRWTAPA